MLTNVALKGQTVIETVIALGAGTVILTAMTLLVVTALNNSQQGASESGANNTAEEGMEIARQMKANNWATFSTLTGSYCVAASCSAITNQSGSCGPKSPSCPVNVNNKYIREITINRNDSSCQPPNPVPGVTYTKVATTVSWKDSKCTSATNPYCHSTKLESCLANYDSRSAP